MTSKKPIRAFIILILALAGISAAVPAMAQSADTSPGWKFELTPYFWGAGLKVDIKIGLLPGQSVDASFSDIWKSLHLAMMGTFEGRKGRLGFLLDGIYISLTKTVPTPGNMFGDLKAGITPSGFSLAGTYRALEGQAALDLVGGLRYTNVAADLELTSGTLAGLQRSSGQGWVDGFVGTRLQLSLAKAWTLVGYADVGAGGSNLSWQALAGLKARFSKTFSGKLGYRYIYFEYDKSPVLFKIGMGGFYAGLGIGF